MEHGLDIFETSSPSYPLMAAMDHCLRWLEADSAAQMARWGDLLEQFSARAEGLRRIRVLCKGGDRVENHPLFYAFDPGKLVISARGAGLTGPQLMAALRGRFQLELEMAAGDYAIAMTSPCDTEEGLARAGGGTGDPGTGKPPPRCRPDRRCPRCWRPRRLCFRRHRLCGSRTNGCRRAGHWAG